MAIRQDTIVAIRKRDARESEKLIRIANVNDKYTTCTYSVGPDQTDEEPVKYMGCGDCDNFSHSLTVPMATNDVDVLQRISKQLFSHFHIDVEDVRGIGLQVTKLESEDNYKQDTRSVFRTALFCYCDHLSKKNHIITINNVFFMTFFVISFILFCVVYFLEIQESD